MTGLVSHPINTIAVRSFSYAAAPGSISLFAVGLHAYENYSSRCHLQKTCCVSHNGVFYVKNVVSGSYPFICVRVSLFFFENALTLPIYDFDTFSCPPTFRMSQDLK